MTNSIKLIKMLPFGSPLIQQHYNHLCSLINLSFDDFQMQLINQTGHSYDELKEYLTDGTEVIENENNLFETESEKILIIHFDIDKPEVIPFCFDIDEPYQLLSNGKELFNSLDRRIELCRSYR